MKTKEIKKEAKQLWETYFTKVMRDCQYDDKFEKLIRQQEKQSEKETIAHLQPWLQILEESIQWLANLSAVLDGLIRKKKSKSKSLLTAWALVGASCTHALALRRLVLSGLDSSARAMLRTLDEHLMVCIVLLHDRNLADSFQQAQDDKAANDFWYKHLNTKALKKHLNKIEGELGIYPHESEELRDWREDEIKIYSQAVPPSFVTASLAVRTVCVSDPNEFGISILGRASAASECTLNYACKTIWYFSRLGFLFLFNEHNGKPPYIELNKEDEMHQIVVIGRDVLTDLNQKYWEYSKFYDSEEVN